VRPKPIIAIEKGIVAPNMPRYFKRWNIPDPPAVGQSFIHLVEHFIAPVADLVNRRFGEANQIGHVDDAIEILFLDVLKNHAVSTFAVNEYFPKLIPGRSIIIQQDYFFDGLPFIKVHQEFFDDKFEYVGEIASSAIFRCISPVTSDDLKRFSQAVRDVDTQIRLVSQTIARTRDPARQVLTAVSKHRLILELQGLERAREYLARLERDFAFFLTGPTVPPRVANAVRAARFLCETDRDPRALKRALVQAQLMALGYVSDGP
jgi:hypothetical protein